jgi:hypothetical protein
MKKNTECVWRITQYTDSKKTRIHKVRYGTSEDGFERSLEAVKHQTCYPFEVYITRALWEEVDSTLDMFKNNKQEG